MLINIIYLTRRATPQSLVNLAVIAQTVSANEDSLVSVGFGGQDVGHEASVRGVLTGSLGCRYRYVNDESLSARLAWSLEVESDWILFVADDDWFSTNHLSSLVNSVRKAHSSVSSVCAQHYAIVSGGKVVQNVYFDSNDGSNAAQRVVAHLVAPFATLRFYGAHRATVASSYLLGPAGVRGRSYLDQLLLLRLAISGSLIPAAEPSAVFYDIGNWTGRIQSAKSDLAFYSSTDEFLSHELNWTKDVYAELSGLPPTVELLEVFQKLVIAKVAHALDMMDTRVRLANCSDQIVASTISRLNSLKEGVRRSTSWSELSGCIATDC